MMKKALQLVFSFTKAELHEWLSGLVWIDIIK